MGDKPVQRAVKFVSSLSHRLVEWIDTVVLEPIILEEPFKLA